MGRMHTCAFAGTQQQLPCSLPALCDTFHEGVSLTWMSFVLLQNGAPIEQVRYVHIKHRCRDVNCLAQHSSVVCFDLGLACINVVCYSGFLASYFLPAKQSERLDVSACPGHSSTAGVL